MLILFTTMTDARHKPQVLSMMRGLYAEDQAASPVDPSLFPRTIDFLLTQRARGRIILFEEDQSLRGYALLIPYWSNEFGGTLLFVDEIFVLPEARRRGIAKAFFQFLDEQKPYDAVALALEVTPANAAARRLYQSLGFHPRSNSILTRRLASV
jgi:GNAT superfamily N-acetyltransferase